MGAVPGPLVRGLARSMLALSAWLDRRAATIVRAAPQPVPDPLDVLRRRYPGAPEAWLRQIAARLGTRPLPAADMPGWAVTGQDPPTPLSPPQPVAARMDPAPPYPGPDPGPAPARPAACRDWPRAIAQAADTTVLPWTRPARPRLSQPVFASADWFIAAPTSPAFPAAPRRAAPAPPRFSSPVMSPAPDAPPQPALTPCATTPSARTTPGYRPTQSPSSAPSSAPDPAWPVAMMDDPAPPPGLQAPPRIASPPAAFPAPPQPHAAPALHLSVRPPDPPRTTLFVASPPPGRPALADWPAMNTPPATVPAPFARSPAPALWPALPACDDGPASADPESEMPGRWAAPRPDQEARNWNG
ncbi:MAG: hypothetical protein ACK41U_04725 [Paracoccus sp. (in: a-proteobacteria)]|uniref:hypothetical protein n=1 Tax=Paracoccus sp. TaxID=267 RepID=UPI003918F734